jgi:hypothetical protein
MKKLKPVLFSLLICGALFFSGCAMAITGSAKVEKECFTKQKTYALVTIAASKEFAGEQGFFQMFQKNEDIAGIDTQPVIDELVPIIRAKLAQTGYFTSVPMKQIVNSKPYLKLPEDEKIQQVAFLKNELNVARGYKYFDDSQKLAQLARDLGVDGVLCVQMNFSVVSMKSELYIAVIAVGKKEYASSAGISVVAYDTEGNILWKDSTMKQAEPGDKKAIVLLDTSDLSGTDFEKMHPSAVLVGSHAVDVLVQRFQDTMEGKKTSVFQKIRDKESEKATQTKS